MSEATVRLGVSVHNGVIGVVLGAVVVREFDDAVAVGPVLFAGEGVGPRVREEVEAEFVVGKVELVDLAEAEEFVKFYWRDCLC